MKTISLAVIEALLTHPDNTFTVADIHKQAQDIMGKPLRVGAISHYISYEWTKKGALKRVSPKDQVRDIEYELTARATKLLEARKANAEKRTYKKPPAGGVGRSKKELDETVGKAVKRMEKDQAKVSAANKTLSTAKTALPTEVDSLTIGDAIVAKIVEMRKQISQLKTQLLDAAYRHDQDNKYNKEIIRGKDNTIRELNAEIERLKKSNQIKRRTIPLAEVATFK